MSDGYNTRAKKLELTMSKEALAQLEEKLINNIQRLRDEILNLKDIGIKNLQEENQKLCIKCEKMESKIIRLEISHNS